MQGILEERFMYKCVQITNNSQFFFVECSQEVISSPQI